MWSKYKHLLTRVHRSNHQKETFLTWTAALCVTFALYLSVWMRFADFGGGSSSSSRRLISEGFSRAASWWCQLASVVVVFVDVVSSDDDDDDRMCCLSEDDVLSCTLTLPERRMNSGGREDLPLTGRTFPTTGTTTTTTAATSTANTVTTTSSRPRLSPSSSLVWHFADSSPPLQQQQQQQTRLGHLYDLRADSPSPFRSPMSPLKTGSSASVYLPFGQMAAHAAAAAAAAALYPPLLPHGRPGFMSGGGGGFFPPRLPPPHQPITSGLQQSYLANPNEPYGQSSLIQISHLPPPPPPPPPPRRPLPIQYPSFLGRLSLDGDSITGSHMISLQQQQQQSPSPSSSHRMTSAFDPFQRSPMPDPPAQVQRSPVQVHFTDDRSQFDHRRTQRRGAGGGGQGGGGGGGTVAPSRSIPHLSTPLPSVARHHQARPPSTLAEIRTMTTSAATRPEQRLETDTFRRLRAEQDRRQTSSSPPSGAIEVCAPPPPATASSAQPQQPPQPHYPPHFVRGSIIQLGSGQLKRIEDLRTTDFVDSAGISGDLRIDSSTVIHMRQNHERNTVVLGFSVGQQNIQVTVEATLEHPFFVYNQGWSSYSPELTRRRYGLNCHQLNVGNCCISLTQGSTPPPPQPTVPAAAQSPLHRPHRHRHRHRHRPVSSDPRGGDAEESGREEEEEEEEEEAERHCSSSSRFVPGFSGFAAHSIGSASVGGAPTTARSTDAPSGATRTGRKRRWSAPDVFHLTHTDHQHRFHQRHRRHHRENIPRSSLDEVNEEAEGAGRVTSSSPPPPPFQLPSTES